MAGVISLMPVSCTPSTSTLAVAIGDPLPSPPTLLCSGVSIGGRCRGGEAAAGVPPITCCMPMVGEGVCRAITLAATRDGVSTNQNLTKPRDEKSSRAPGRANVRRRRRAGAGRKNLTSKWRQNGVKMYQKIAKFTWCGVWDPRDLPAGARSVAQVRPRWGAPRGLRRALGAGLPPGVRLGLRPGKGQVHARMSERGG